MAHTEIPGDVSPLLIENRFSFSPFPPNSSPTPSHPEITDFLSAALRSDQDSSSVTLLLATNSAFHCPQQEAPCSSIFQAHGAINGNALHPENLLFTLTQP